MIVAVTERGRKQVSDRELMAKAFAALNVFQQRNPTKTVENILMELEDRISEIKEEESKYKLSKEVRDKMRLAAEGNRYRWKPELDAPYQEIKQLIAMGVQVICACEAVGMSKDRYYRRKRIEETGRDRGGMK